MCACKIGKVSKVVMDDVVSAQKLWVEYEIREFLFWRRVKFLIGLNECTEVMRPFVLNAYFYIDEGDALQPVFGGKESFSQGSKIVI